MNIIRSTGTQRAYTVYRKHHRMLSLHSLL